MKKTWEEKMIPMNVFGNKVDEGPLSNDVLDVPLRYCSPQGPTINLLPSDGPNSTFDLRTYR